MTSLDKAGDQQGAELIDEQSDAPAPPVATPPRGGGRGPLIRRIALGLAIGVVATAILLGERQTLSDIIGYTLIFAASVCVMLPSRTPVPPEPT